LTVSISPIPLAPTGSTGNNTHITTNMPDMYEGLALEMIVTAVGATPTITYKYQGSLDGTNWYDMAYITDASDTVSVATRVMTAVARQVSFMSNPLARNYVFVRLVTSANTNVTYRAEARPI
jgi:hypothetical protein